MQLPPEAAEDAAVGVAILALGGLLLLIGAGTSVGNPSEFDTWLDGVGLVLLLGALGAIVWRMAHG